MENETKNEVGREFTAYELMLLCGFVVIVTREDRPYAYTAWVTQVTPKFVVFRAGEIQTYFMAMRHEDGTLTDDTGRRIRVYEYLGEI
jgi:hypothetical protein